jgi:hypothetical protein
MPPKKSFGTPNIQGSTVQELAQSVQFWMQHFTDRLDTLAGLRGTSSFYGPVDTNGHPIRNVGDPPDENSAVPARLTLTRRPNPGQIGHGEQWDAKGLQIFNIGSGDHPQDAATINQLGEATDAAIQKSGPTGPPPSIAQGSSTGDSTAGFAYANHTHAPLVPFGLAVIGQQTYLIANVTPQRTYDTTTVTLPELASILATLIDDLRAQLLVT